MRQLQHIRQWADGHYGTSVGWAIALLTLWQLVIAVFGVDLCDSGYYLLFFENIFKAPEAVEYNFMYYLSGVAGAALNAVLPEGGKWMAMRVAGVLCNAGAMAILACALKRVIPATAVILGFMMVVASLVQFPFTFNNDLMSALLWVAAVACMFKGLTGGKRVHLLLAGLVVGVNTFTRIPNVLAVGLAVMPFVARFHIKRPLRECWRQCGNAGLLQAMSARGPQDGCAVAARLGGMALRRQQVAALGCLACCGGGSTLFHVAPVPHYAPPVGNVCGGARVGHL